MSFGCIACSQAFESFDEWHKHVEAHTFEEGFVCPESICNNRFISIHVTPLIAEMHSYLDHAKDVQTAKEISKDPMNYICPWKGRIWCGKCNKTMDLGGNATPGKLPSEAIAHFILHVRNDGSASTLGARSL